MSTETMSTASSSLNRSLINGVLGGLVGGLVFGVMMGVQGMLPMVGMLIGQENAIVGFVVHMVISGIFGLAYGVVAPRLPSSWAVTISTGVVYGVILWVVGALVLMPLMLGMNEMVLQIGDMQISSLIGHIIFGLILAGTFKILSARA